MRRHPRRHGERSPSEAPRGRNRRNGSRRARRAEQSASSALTYNRAMRRIALLFVVTLFTLPLRAQWTALGDMPQPSQQGNVLRFENAQAIAVVTALSPDIIRV